ncbi:hypothetical protein KKA24_00585, partial [Patescibacteria group bacterium]|nr:hypothetical protein [Patescibacteria group bacterium]
MKRLIKFTFLITFLLLLLPVHFAYSQTPPVSQTIGGLEKTEKDIERKKELDERIIKEKEEEEEIVEEKGIPLEEEKKILIKKIEVRGVTLISKRIVNKIVSGYEGKELSLKEIQKICDLITDEYRKKGYVTSRAYLPPQTIKEGLLIIMVIEGKLGKIEIKGNRFFKTSLLKKKLRLEPGEYFDYKSLQKSLRIINEHPDREVRSVLVPGTEPGTTDIVLEVTDRLPVHIGFNYDNFGSRFIEKDRYALSIEHNKLLG